MKRTFLLILIIVLLLTLGMLGCSSQQNTEQPAITPAATELVEIVLAAPALTPVPTTPPDTIPTAEPAVALTPKPTAEEKGRVDIADGFYYIELNDEIKKRITGISYPENDEHCQVQYDDLRYIKIKHYDFDGNILDGELIVNEKVAEEVTNIFCELYKQKYQMTSVRLVDDYGEPRDDTKSMEANNTSALCYRRSTGTNKLSLHSFGLAIDINPKLNPYIVGDRIAPANGAEYADRTKDFPGKIDKNDLAYKLFKKYDWRWGGTFSDRDYQHFDKDLGYNREKN